MNCQLTGASAAPLRPTGRSRLGAGPPDEVVEELAGLVLGSPPVRSESAQELLGRRRVEQQVLGPGVYHPATDHPAVHLGMELDPGVDAQDECVRGRPGPGHPVGARGSGGAVPVPDQPRTRWAPVRGRSVSTSRRSGPIQTHGPGSVADRSDPITISRSNVPAAGSPSRARVGPVGLGYRKSQFTGPSTQNTGGIPRGCG